METSFTDHFGRTPDDAFLRFTYSGDPEAYKRLAWIGGKGLKTANFAALSEGGPSYARQAGDVSLFKVTELPPAKAPKAVQDHYMKLRDTMDDFGTNRIGPLEAERRINMLTGGGGMVEVAEQFGVTLQGGVNQMCARQATLVPFSFTILLRSDEVSGHTEYGDR